MIFEKLKYAEEGVFQCWSCENCVGHTEHRMRVLDNTSQRRLITFCLPECRVANKYMLYTNKVPCEKYRCSIHTDKETTE